MPRFLNSSNQFGLNPSSNPVICSTLTEGVISYKLRFPFNDFMFVPNPDNNKPMPFEPMESLADKGIEANDNEKVQSGYMKSCELAVSLKNQGLAKNFANPIQSGWRRLAVCEVIIKKQ